MNAQIVIFFIAAVFQANAVPFLKERPGGVFGGISQLGNNIVSQGKDVVDKVKDKVEEVKEEARETVENFPNSIVENAKDVISNGKDVIETVKEEMAEAIENLQNSMAENIPDLISNMNEEHVYDLHQYLGNTSSIDISSALEQNLPGVPISPAQIFEIAEGFNHLHTVACDAVLANFNIQTSICKNIKIFFMDSAKFITNSIMKIIHPLQAGVVKLIEKGQEMPIKTLDLMEKSSKKIIDLFEKFAPPSIREYIIPLLRETSERNIEITREYLSRLYGGKFGEMIEHIKTAINGGVPPETAVHYGFHNGIQSSIDRFQAMQTELNDRLENIPSILDLVTSGIKPNDVAILSQMENVIEKVQEQFKDKMDDIMDKVADVAADVEKIKSDAEWDQEKVQDTIKQSVNNVLDDFQEHMPNIAEIPDHPEFKDQMKEILKNPFKDLTAEIGKVVFGIINDFINKLKETILGVETKLEGIGNEGAAFSAVGQGFGNPETSVIPSNNVVNPISSGGGASAAAGGATWDDPKKIFITLI